MSGPTSGGWGPPSDPYEPPPPPSQPPPSQPPTSQPPTSQPPTSQPPQPPQYQPPPPYQPPPYQPPPYQPPTNQPPSGPANYGGGYGPPPNYGPPPGYGPYGAGGAPRPGGSNRTVLAVIGVVVVALVVSGLVVVLTRKSGSNTPSLTGALTSAATTSAATTSAATTTPSTTGASTTNSETTSASTSSTSTSSTSTSSTSTSSTNNNLNLCIENDASTDLIHLTVTLSFAKSYKTADKFDRDVLNSCVTPAALKELGPYYGKSFGLPGGDLTGENGNGATARYSVQLVNTSKYVTFTLNRKVGTSGYQVVSLTAS
jgi:hypothetical protein